MELPLFMLYAILACGGALAVVLSQNVVRMAFYLVISLGSTAGLFFLLNADFIGATQILIYVGGTVVLLIFGVMLTSSSTLQAIPNNPGEVAKGAVVGVAFLAVLLWTVMTVNWEDARSATLHGPHQLGNEAGNGFNPIAEGNTARPIGLSLLSLRFDKDLTGAAEAAAPGAKPAMSTGYLLPFEIISVHLLVVLVGASYLARAKRRTAA